jgi:hypothetical protein
VPVLKLLFHQWVAFLPWCASLFFYMGYSPLVQPIFGSGGSGYIFGFAVWTPKELFFAFGFKAGFTTCGHFGVSIH